MYVTLFKFNQTDDFQKKISKVNPNKYLKMQESLELQNFPGNCSFMIVTCCIHTITGYLDGIKYSGSRSQQCLVLQLLISRVNIAIHARNWSQIVLVLKLGIWKSKDPSAIKTEVNGHPPLFPGRLQTTTAIDSRNAVQASFLSIFALIETLNELI